MINHNENKEMSWKIGDSFTETFYDGQRFNSIKSLSVHCGIPYKTLYARLRAGWPLEESVKSPLRYYSFYYNNQHFESKKHFAEFYNLHYGTLVSRLNRLGWTLEECIDPSLRRKKIFTYKNQDFFTIREFSEQYGLNYGSVRRHLKLGWTPEECLNPSLRKAVKFSHNGIKFTSVVSFARYFNLHEGNTRRRYKAEWSLEECIDSSSRKRPISRGAKVIIQGKKFNSLTAAAKFYGESRQNVTARVARGWTIEQAVKIEPTPDFRAISKKNEIIFLGKVFPSKTARDAYFGLNKSCIEKRLSRGWSQRQAAGLDPKPSNKPNWLEREVIDGREYPKTAKGDYKLYVVKNTFNSKEYIGITVSPLDARLRGHRRAALALKGTSKLYNAMRKYGVDNFTIHLVRNDATNYSQLGDQEVAEIANRNTIKNGYNLSPGGSIGTSKTIVVDGETFASYTSAAQFFGIDSSLFNYRLRSGKSPEAAAGLIEPDRPYSYGVAIGDQRYPSLQKACEAQNLSYKAVWNRINKFGWTQEQALGIESSPESYERYQAGNKVNVCEHQFESQNQMAQFLEISPAAISKRIKNGESFQSIYDHFKNGGGRRRSAKAA